MRELDTLGMTPGIEGQSFQAAHEACSGCTPLATGSQIRGKQKEGLISSY